MEKDTEKTANMTQAMQSMQRNPGQTMRMKALSGETPEVRKPPPKPSASLSGQGTAFTGIFRTGKIDIDEIIDSHDRARRMLLPGTDRIRIEHPENLPILEQQYDMMEEKIAEGGMSGISRARDICLKRIVAIKTLKTTPETAEDDRLGFINEAQLTSQLDHPSIIPIYSLSTDTNQGLHMGMKMVHGKTLKERLELVIRNYRKYGIRRFDEQKSLIFRLNTFLNICDAISYAHNKKIIHGDLKPENIMIGEYHETYVMDWGIARMIKPNGFAENIDPPGTISGTPKYISPEAVSGKDLDKRADIFSLGLILFELVTLNFGTVGTESSEIMINTRNGVLHPVRHRFGCRIDPDIAAIVRKATATDRKDRYQTTEELAADIRRFLQGNEVSANPDSIFRRTGRWLHRHVKSVAISSLIVLLAAGLITVVSTARSFFASSENQMRQRLLAYVFTEMMTTGSCLDKSVMSLENDARSIAESVVFLCQNGTSFPDKKIYYANPGSPEPPGLRNEPAYQRKVTLNTFTCVYPGKQIKPEYTAMLSKLYPLKELMQEVLFKKRSYGLTGSFLRSPMIWVTIGLENGILITFPGFHEMVSGYDVRFRPWYRYTIRKNGPQWGAPYLDAASEGLLISCTCRMIGPNGLPFGVVSLDVAVREWARLLNATGNKGEYVLEKMLINPEGYILIGDINQPFYNAKGTTDSGFLNMHKIPDPDLIKSFRALSYGYISRMENGKNILYLFMKLYSFPGFYVERIDYEKLKQNRTAAGFSLYL